MQKILYKTLFNNYVLISLISIILKNNFSGTVWSLRCSLNQNTLQHRTLTSAHTIRHSLLMTARHILSLDGPECLIVSVTLFPWRWLDSHTRSSSSIGASSSNEPRRLRTSAQRRSSATQSCPSEAEAPIQALAEDTWKPVCGFFNDTENLVTGRNPCISAKCFSAKLFQLS